MVVLPKELKGLALGVDEDGVLSVFAFSDYDHVLDRYTFVWKTFY